MGVERNAILTLVFVAGCTARIGDSGPSQLPGPPAGGGGGGGGGARDGGVVEPPPPVIPPFEPSTPSLHRLTRGQYTNTLVALFGADVPVPTDLEVDTSLYGFTTVGAASLSIGPRAAEQFESAALSVSAWAFADPARRQGLLGCAPADATDPCVREFLARFGRRAWRRPLSAEELDRWAGVALSLSSAYQDVWRGLELTVAGLLEAPSFLYRVEIGVPDPAASGRLRYTGLEMAARLSYFLWNTTPDEALLDAAERGDLDTAEGVRAAARRMLGTPGAQRALARFFYEHLKLDRLEGATKNPQVFPQMSPTLTASMREEIERVMSAVALEGDRDFREVFTTRSTFLNAELARLYSLPAIDGPGFVPYELPNNGPRAGILTSGGFLALNAHETVTSPTYRGRFIRQSLLCQDIPPPPPGVSTELPAPDPNQGPETLRQRLERLHFRNPTCAACHLRMDPLGFTFESFDAIGAYRTTDNGLPVDPRGELDGTRVMNAKELAQTLAQRADVGSCIARMAYRYASGHLETPGETATVVALGEAFERSGFRFKELVVELVASDGFRLAQVEE